MTGPDAPASGEGFDIRAAWRRDDPQIEADAIAMWTQLGILPSDVKPEDRAKQIVAAAYCGDRLAALATAVVEQIDWLGARMLVLRGMTAPEFRRSHAQVALSLPVKEILETWAAAHPGERIGGVIGYVERGLWGDLSRMPVTPPWPLTLIAYTHDGQQVRAAWFDHFRLD